MKKDQPEASAGRVDNKSKSPIQEREASRKQAKEALRQSEEFLRTTFDYASVGMAIGAPDQTFVQTNAAFNRMLGYEPGELTGVHWSAVTPPEDVAQTEDRYHRFVQSGMPSIAFEKRYVRKDGTVIWTDANVSLVRDTEGNAKFAIATVQDITERKRAEEALVRAKEEWERTFATVPDLIAILDNQHRVVRVNQAMAGRFGASPEECIGLRCYEVVHGLPEPPEFCPHSRTMKDGQQHIAEVHEERLGGDFVVSTTPLHDDQGTMIGTVHVAHDITKRKRAETRVQREMGFKDFLLLLHEKAPQLGDKELYDYFLEETVRLTDSAIGFFHRVSDDQKNVVLTTWNREALKSCTASYETHYLLEQAGNWADCVRLKQPVIYNDFPHSPNRKGLPDGHAPVRRFMSIPVMEGKKVRAIFGVGNKAGEYDETDAVQVQLVANALHAIMEGRRAEMALRTAHDELELRVQERTAELQRQAGLINLSPDAILVRNAQGTITFWSAGAAALYGWSAEEAVGRNTRELLQSQRPGLPGQVLNTVMKTGGWEGELHQRKKDGTDVIVSSRLTLQRDKDGKPVAILQINSDITEKKRIEDQLRQAHKMEAIGTLAGGIAHDFNNVLAAIIGFTELAKDNVPPDAEAQHHLNRIFQSGLRGRELVKQILAFSRKAKGERKELTLTPLIKETHALLRSSLPTTIQMPLAITTDHDYVLADPTQLQQVLMNLATNAADAMREEGGQLTIELSSAVFPEGSVLPDPAMEPGAYVKLTVKDTGTGMTEDVRERIFEPFFTTKELGKGTGMGLAVVYGVIKNHNGSVTVKSEVGQGSTFDVFLPQVQRPEATKEETRAVALPGGTERVLFVDDEELLMEMGQGMLERLGYRVTVAANGTQAWNLFSEDPSRFDLVITDQTMPDVTGLTLARKMLKVREELPIILCTGYSEMVSPEKAKDVGICAFVMKPVVRKDLAETVRRVLDGGTVGIRR